MWTNELCAPTADFWGPVSNFGIPAAAVMDTQKDPDMYAITSYGLQYVSSLLVSHTRVTLSTTVAGSLLLTILAGPHYV